MPVSVTVIHDSLVALVVVYREVSYYWLDILHGVKGGGGGVPTLSDLYFSCKMRKH